MMHCFGRCTLLTFALHSLAWLGGNSFAFVFFTTVVTTRMPLLLSAMTCIFVQVM